ncbi:MAG: hypothetical protein JWQ10_750, partial [Herbaspirillum sp.]|nr:hypothetical protein [Herbaspirillum sp.]
LLRANGVFLQFSKNPVRPEQAVGIRGTYTEGGSAGVLDWVRRDGDDPMFEEKIANLSDIIYANQPRYFPNK